MSVLVVSFPNNREASGVRIVQKFPSSQSKGLLGVHTVVVTGIGMCFQPTFKKQAAAQLDVQGCNVVYGSD